MFRFKYYKITSKSTIKEITSILKDNNYQENKKYGFELIDFEYDFVEAKYHEKTLIKERIINPLGGEENIEYIKYLQIFFGIIKVDKNTLLLKIESAPRSIKQFILYLFDLQGIESITPLFLDIEEIYNHLLKTPELSRLKVNKLLISSIMINKNSSARIEIKSNDNAYKDFKASYNYKSYKIENMHLDIRYLEKPYNIYISSNGSLKFSKDITPLVENLIISNLIENL